MTLPLKVWSRFTVTGHTCTLKFRIVEAPEERLEDIVDMIMQYFTTEESISKATGVAESEESLTILRSHMLVTLKSTSARGLVCCADNGSNEIGEIIGGTFMWLIKDEITRNIPINSKELQKFSEVARDIITKYDIKAEQNVSKFYDARFVVVHPNYRGLGIAQELFKIMPQVCKEDCVPLIVGFMTAYGTQKAAERAGWKTLYEFSYEEIENKFGITFAKDDPPTCKIMAARAQD